VATAVEGSIPRAARRSRSGVFLRTLELVYIRLSNFLAAFGSRLGESAPLSAIRAKLLAKHAVDRIRWMPIPTPRPTRRELVLFLHHFAIKY
jgi:hypothetical protein